MSASTKTKQAPHNFAYNNSHKDSISKSTKRSIKANSENKIVRDLRQQFDDYVLKQDNAEDRQDSRNVGEEDEVQQVDEEGSHQIDDLQQQNLRHSTGQKSNKNNHQHVHTKSRALSYLNINTGGVSQSNSRKIKINKLVSQHQPQHAHSNTLQVPRSYLLALEHLQSAVEDRDAQILSLKDELMEKQEIIYECQTKINQVLIKYHELNDFCGLKEAEIRVLKQQMDELKRDKQITLKQAARIVRDQFKGEATRIIHDDNTFATFKNRSMSSNLGTSIHRQPLLSASYSKQLTSAKDPMPNFKKSIIMSTQVHRPAEPIVQKVSMDSIHPSFTARPSTTTNSPFLCSSPPMQLSEKQKNRDFISYQREVLRNQKQLIALKYRMECLERKLSTNPKEDNVKQKIRKLSEEIESKQRSINDLKRL